MENKLFPVCEISVLRRYVAVSSSARRVFEKIDVDH
jgi:hypothetical protein